MKVRLNLYTSRFRPRRLLLDRRMLAVSLGLTVCLLIISGVWLHGVSRNLEAEYTVATDRQTELETRMIELSGHLEGRGENPQLRQSIAEALRRVGGKRQLIKALSERMLLVDVRFSRYMQGLSKSHVEGLWLTRVRAQGSDLTLNGSSLSEDLLPQWLQQLSSQADFRGKNFGFLELSRQKDGQTPYLDFHLSTQLTRDGKGNG